MQSPMDRFDLIVLAYLWCQPAKAVEAKKLELAIKPLVTAGSAKSRAETSLNRLVQSNFAEEVLSQKKPEFRITLTGQQRICQALKRDVLPAGKTPFKTILEQDVTAMALDLAAPGSDRKSQKDFGDLLKLVVCARHFQLDLPLDAGPVAAKLQLVKIAISKANQIPLDRIHLTKLPADSVLLALVVGPLLGEPATAAAKLDKLIASKVFAILDVTKPAQIKAGVVRQWLNQSVNPTESVSPATTETAAPFDLKSFATHVVEAAREVARTNALAVSNLGDKVLVHFVHQAYEKWFTAMPIDAFKQHLSDANGDLLVLVREDMIPEDRRQEFLDSEVRRGPSSYHYIRIGSLGVNHGGV